jgi:hypothetical protein
LRGRTVIKIDERAIVDCAVEYRKICAYFRDGFHFFVRFIY